MVEEKIDERRSFEDSKSEIVYYIGLPNAEDIRGADWQYSKVYTKCLTEGIPTSAELMDILRKRDIVGENFEKRANELSGILHEAIIQLELSDDLDEKAKCAVDVARAREALFQWNQRLSGPMSNTCEQIADDARLEYLTACIIQNEDGSKVWENYDAFLASNKQTLTMKSRYEVMLYLQGYESDFLERTPEALAMKEVESDIMRRTTLAIEAEKAKQKAEEELVEVEEKPQEDPTDKDNIKTVKKTTKKSSNKK